MSMLAEAKTRPSWVLNPRASEWSKDQNKLGQKMLEKMGWSVGKGLGAKEQGPVEAIRIKFKGDSRGLGAGRKKEQEDWLQQQESFQSLLEGLNGTNDRSVCVKSLEEKSKTSRTKIHYHKFARGKDISRYSAKDLSCIVGTGFVPIKLPETGASTPEGTSVVDTGSLNNDGSSCVEFDSGDHWPSCEETMNCKRSRTGRELKPSAKVAAVLEDAPSLPKKKKLKEKPVEIDFVAPSKSSKGLNAVNQSEEPTKKRKGGEVNPSNPNLKQSPSPTKKRKAKRKCTEPILHLENGAASSTESISDHQDREHSRSGRAYKPTAKISGLEMASSPKKKKTKGKSTELLLGSESTSESNTKLATNLPLSPKKKKAKEQSMEVLPESESVSESTSKVTTSFNESPKKKKIKGKSMEDESILESTKLATNFERPPQKKKTKDKSKGLLSVIEADSETERKPEDVYSRSKREPKPTAKALEYLAEETFSPKKRKHKGKSKELLPGDDSGFETPSKPGKSSVPARIVQDHKLSTKALASLDEEPSPKKKKTKQNLHDKVSALKMPVASSTVDTSHSRSGREYKRSARMKVCLEETSLEPSKTSKTKMPNKDAVKEHHLSPSGSSSSQVQTKKQKEQSSKKKVAAGHIEVERNKSSKKLLPPTDSGCEVKEGTERMKSKKSKQNVTYKVIKNNPELGKNDEGSSETKRLLGKNKIISVDTEIADEIPKHKKKKKEMYREELALNDELSHCSAVTLTSMAEGPKPNGYIVENDVAEAEQDVELPGEEPRVERRRKRKDVGGLVEPENGISEHESPSNGTKKGRKKKAKDESSIIPEACEKEEFSNEASESSSKTKKRKKNQNLDNPGEEITPNVAKSKKNVDISAVKADPKDSSESQETAVSKGQDSEDNTEDLASINSQSSLIYEMIGSAPGNLKVGNEPEELKKYHILASDDEGDV